MTCRGCLKTCLHLKLFQNNLAPGLNVSAGASECIYAEIMVGSKSAGNGRLHWRRSSIILERMKEAKRCLDVLGVTFVEVDVKKAVNFQ